jgi:hypothetical protein
MKTICIYHANCFDEFAEEEDIKMQQVLKLIKSGNKRRGFEA